MEPLFICKYARTPQLAKELYRRCLLGSPAYLILDVISLILLAAAIFILIRSGEVNWFYFLYPVLILFFELLLYHRSAKMLIRRDMELYGRPHPVFEYSATQDSLYLRDQNGSFHDISFGQLKRVVCSKGVIILITKAKQALLFPKDSFTKGSAIEFADFLRSKGFRVKHFK